jgi:hypothetical protein
MSLLTYIFIFIKAVALNIQIFALTFKKMLKTRSKRPNGVGYPHPKKFSTNILFLFYFHINQYLKKIKKWGSAI